MWLHSSVGRASHRYRGGHGFESRRSPDFFRFLLYNCLNWKIYCHDHSSLSCGLSFLLVLASLRGFCSGFSSFPRSTKINNSIFQFDLETVDEEPLQGNGTANFHHHHHHYYYYYIIIPVIISSILVDHIL